MRSIAVIPARMDSSRFPGKPLATLNGRTMLEHVYRRTAMCDVLDDVIVATCDVEIADAVSTFGGEVIMTSNKHERASDRVAEVAKSIDSDVYVLVQGDEPMTHPNMISQALSPFSNDSSVGCVNLTTRITDLAEFRSPNTIKVAINQEGGAMYMSRSEIPTLHKNKFEDIEAFKQVCVIPFSRAALNRYAALSPTPNEIAESIDMMRFIEHGDPVLMVETNHITHAVDTEADRQLVEKMMESDPLIGAY